MADETKDPITHIFYKAVGTLLGIGFAVGVVLSLIVWFVTWLILS